MDGNSVLIRDASTTGSAETQFRSITTTEGVCAIDLEDGLFRFRERHDRAGPFRSVSYFDVEKQIIQERYDGFQGHSIPPHDGRRSSRSRGFPGPAVCSIRNARHHIKRQIMWEIPPSATRPRAWNSSNNSSAEWLGLIAAPVICSPRPAAIIRRVTSLVLSRAHTQTRRKDREFRCRNSDFGQHLSSSDLSLCRNTPGASLPILRRLRS